ncbi:sodium-coupled monocarboxylate transporter 2 [Ictidomys tridecemlineatus]|uniref:Solute carrier family 5 member 12 n=1 Tax=Ictidomys tridecemlineatus TaxID=43179 RepID=A0A287D8A9_ICTTR|nr:sodium-coupled monocarboxylate transporter 2 [Ictidomys tridecemlineatus]KAG3285571.1 solute carrier family 5 member 12 [Ictidomys tridecemlineatus]
MEAKSFSVWDYVVFSALFVVSCGIGIFFAIKERKKATSREFLVGGRQMSFGPVALSLTASFMSAVTVLGTPSEVYRFGASFILFFISYTFVIIFTSELFLPVFYRSGITSTYEYLQLRFNKVVRYAATVIYIVQTILYTGVVVYAPALALNQVTGFDLWGSVFATGIVCTFYCTLGGLKAVVWTDAFQMIVMIVGFLTVLIQGSAHNGGLQNVLEQASNGSRLHIVDFDVDPLRRHTLWTIAVGGTFTWLGIYGVNQSTIQRCISCKTEKHAKLALYFNLLGLWIILVCAVFSGLIMYSHFKDCDPWTSGMISAPDQLMPYFVMELFATMPGLPGLFVACAFSGTLSTVAASINALATVTFEDFVKSCFPHLSDELSTWISKGLCLLFGILCTSMAVAASLLGGVVQAALSIHGMCGGPMLGLFSLGLVFPFVNWKGALGGLITGITLSFWVAIGAFIYPAPDSKTWPLPLSTEQCFHSNMTTAAPPELSNRPTIADTWYSLSYLYYSAVGCLGCIIAGVIISFITGHQRGKDVDPLLIRPVCNLFCFWSKKYKTLCWCGVQHDRGTEQDNLANDGAWKQGAESVLQNGLQQESLTHVPGYDPKDKSHDNMALEKMTYF